MKQLHKSEFGTKFHIPDKQPIRGKTVIKVTRIGGVTEEQFANDIKEFVLTHSNTIDGRIDLRVVG